MEVISASDVKKLRDMTGAAMMDCKKALTESNGDFEAAIDILRKKGQKVSAARADRSASEGSVFMHTNGKVGYLVALNCETDFVAKNQDFLTLGKNILDAAVTKQLKTMEQLQAALVEGRSVAEHIVDLVGKIGEKIEVSAFEVLESEQVISYIHTGSKLGVLVALANTNGANLEEAGRDVAMQIAAMSPIAVNKEDVDATTIQREIEIGKEQARAEGKPEEMLEKIALGKLNKFYQERTLLNQEFVKEAKTTVAQYLDRVQKGLTVSAFRRVSIG